MVTWLYNMQFHSKHAHRYGSVTGLIWRNIYKSKINPPRSEKNLHRHLLKIAFERGDGEGVYAILRNQVKGESRGFHMYGMYFVTRRRLMVLKSFPEHRGIPHSRPELDVYHKRKRKIYRKPRWVGNLNL